MLVSVNTILATISVRFLPNLVQPFPLVKPFNGVVNFEDSYIISLLFHGFPTEIKFIRRFYF